MENHLFYSLAFIPYIFFNGKHSSFIRHDYWRSVTELFSQSFTKQIGDWCRDNDLQFTGHFLWENSMGVATRVCGAIMPNYMYMDAPGIDMLCEQTDEVITAKQCTSVVNQLGMEQVVTETYGCTGWDFTFEGQKWIGDFQYVMGVNLRSQHLALYSLKGCRKRDYPPVFSYNTSWWEHNNVVEEYFARISQVMSKGKAVRDVLVIHPSSTAWSTMGSNPYHLERRGSDRDIPYINEYGEEFNELIKYMLDIHYDYDLGDETIISKYACVEDNLFKINNAKYKVVVIPRIDTMLRSTAELVEKFIKNGGKVIAIDTVPTMVEGRKSDELDGIFNHRNCVIIKDKEELLNKLPNAIDRQVGVVDKDGNEISDVFYLLKEDGPFKYLFIINNSKSAEHEAFIEINTSGSVEEWNTLTGEINSVTAEKAGDKIRIYTKLFTCDSKLYVIDTHNKANESLSLQSEEYEKCVELTDPETFETTMENSLILDKCQYKIKDSSWSETKDVWMCQKEIREKLSMRQIYYNGLVQRYRWIKNEHPNNGTKVALKFEFNVLKSISSEINLVIEAAKNFKILLNNIEQSNQSVGYFLDKSFDRVKLSNVEVGRNELIIECDYCHWMELEDCYLVGKFGVNTNMEITTEPKKLMLGDWCKQGYKFYIGSMKYNYELDVDLKDNTK
jgi:hypothetical protein